LADINLKKLNEMISDIVKAEIGEHRNKCVAARDADFMERSQTPSKISVTDYYDYKKEIEQKKKEKKKRFLESESFQYILLLSLFALGFGASILIGYIYGL